MTEQDREIIKSLSELAWADGAVSPEERSLLIKILIEAGADPADSQEIDALLARPSDNIMSEPANLGGVELEEERRLSVMRALLIMSFMDGVLSFAEFNHIERVQKELGISHLQLDILRAEAIEAAESLRDKA